MASKSKITRLVELPELIHKYQVEKDIIIKQRLLMLVHIKSGKSARETGKILFVNKCTVSAWVNRFNELGFEGLSDNYRSGRPQKIDYEELKKVLSESPKEYGYKPELWYPSLVRRYLREQKGIEISKNYVYALIKRIGFVLRVPRGRSYKSDPNKVVQFKKNAKHNEDGGSEQPLNHQVDLE